MSISFEIQSVSLEEEQDVTVLYEVCFGKNWSLTQGDSKGATFMGSSSDIESNEIFYHHKIELEFDSKGLSHSPVIIFTLIGYDLLCREIIIGYSY